MLVAFSAAAAVGRSSANLRAGFLPSLFLLLLFFSGRS
jgi:hypothetical protein